MFSFFFLIDYGFYAIMNKNGVFISVGRIIMNHLVGFDNSFSPQMPSPFAGLRAFFNRLRSRRRKNAWLAQGWSEKMTDFIDTSLINLGIHVPEEKHVFIMLFSAVLFSAVCHVVQVSAFLILGNAMLAILNFSSICIYVVCVALLVWQKPALCGLLFTAEITIVATIMSYLIGTETFLFSYFFVVLLIQMMIPYASWKVRLPAIAGIVFLLFVCFMIGNVFTPVVDIAPIRTFYTFFNILIGAGCIISIIAVNNQVNKILTLRTKRKLDQYRSEAHLDALTGLYNRRFAKIIFEEIANDANQHDSWCVAMLDIDNFKQINDKFGHDFGDTVLRRLADMIKSSLRKTDYVFRWGGEEFLLLLSNTTLHDSHQMLDKMRIKIQDSKLSTLRDSTFLTVTIGVSQCTLGLIEESIRASDKKLYKGKCSGKNMVVS